MREELCKLFRGKLIWGLVLLSVMVNFGLLFVQKDKINTLRIIDDFNVSNGSVVSDEKMAILKEIWNTAMVKDISWEEFQDNIESAAGYYEGIQSSDLASSYFYQMHLEGILAAVIVTLYSIDMERTSRTISIVYSTRKGKNIIRDKLFAAVSASLICIMSIAAITFLIACCVFPVGIIINTLISNPMVTLKGGPCIARETMTIGTYIIKSLGMSCVLSVIYSLGNFAIGVRAKNGYYAFGILIVLSGIMKVLSAAAPTSTCMFFWTQYNPLDLVLKAGTWFLYNANNFSPSAYEGCTLAIWFVVCAGGCICGLWHVKRKKVRL